MTSNWAWWLLTAAFSFALLHDLGVIGVELPQNRRQVRNSVLEMPATAGALMFGFELGTGVRTYVPSAAPIAVSVITILAGSFATGLLLGLGFGVARGLTAIDRLVSRDRSKWDEVFQRRRAALSPIGTTVAFAALSMALVVA